VGKFVKNRVHQFEFDDTKIRVVLKPINLEDLLSFTSLPMDEEGRMNHTLPFFKKLVMKYVKEFDFTDANGEEVTKEDLCECAFLMPLLVEIANKLSEDGHIPDPPKSGAV